MYFKEKKVDRIILTTASSGTMYPLKDMDENDLYLSDFHWYDKERPLKVDDLSQNTNVQNHPKTGKH